MVFSSVFEMLGFPSISQLLLAASLTLQLRSLKEYLRKSECWQSKLKKLNPELLVDFSILKEKNRGSMSVIFTHFKLMFIANVGKYTIN